MASRVAYGAVRGGPLASAGVQWLVLGLGAVTLLGNERIAASLLKGVEKLLLAVTDGSASSNSHNNGDRSSMAPIVYNVMTPGSGSGGSRSMLWSLVQYSLAAGVCWGVYVVGSDLLPDTVAQLLPVTRRVFDQAVSSLGQGLLQVRDVLSRQIQALVQGQEELREKQDATQETLERVQEELHAAHVDVQNVSLAVGSCQDSLDHAEKMQTYTAKGVRLLATCVAGLLPQHAPLYQELQAFAREHHPTLDNRTTVTTTGQQQRAATRTATITPRVTANGTAGLVYQEEELRVTPGLEPRRIPQTVHTVPKQSSSAVYRFPGSPGSDYSPETEVAPPAVPALQQIQAMLASARQEETIVFTK